MMIKSKFGDAVRSKSDVAARNEVLAKVLCHNICCLIGAMYELGIKPMLGQVKAAQQKESCTSEQLKTVPLCKAPKVSNCVASGKG